MMEQNIQEKNPTSFTTQHTHSNYRNWKFLINSFHKYVLTQSIRFHFLLNSHLMYFWQIFFLFEIDRITNEMLSQCENSVDRCNEVIDMFEHYISEFIQVRMRTIFTLFSLAKYIRFNSLSTDTHFSCVTRFKHSI
jgi:hypothetical protein